MLPPDAESAAEALAPAAAAPSSNRGSSAARLLPSAFAASSCKRVAQRHLKGDKGKAQAAEVLSDVALSLLSGPAQPCIASCSKEFEQAPFHWQAQNCRTR